MRKCCVVHQRFVSLLGVVMGVKRPSKIEITTRRGNNQQVDKSRRTVAPVRCDLVRGAPYDVSCIPSDEWVFRLVLAAAE